MFELYDKGQFPSMKQITLLPAKRFLLEAQLVLLYVSSVRFKLKSNNVSKLLIKFQGQ
jgi:hypothetical protein